jgi:CubicO group peptidase (beta-lactamase class C family)
MTRAWPLLCLALCGCADAPTDVDTRVALVSDSGRVYVPEAEWRTAPPAALGMDTARLRAVERGIDAGRYGALHGVVVIRFGYLALEEYYDWAREQPHTMQSVTKSVASLLLGILAARPGQTAAADLDRPVLDVFGRYERIANVDERKRALTLRHLLTMRTGMDFWEQPYAGSPLEQLNRSTGDWTRFVLDRPMTGAPGEAWAYNSGAAILVGAVIREISGSNLDEFARRELFDPIGVRGESWYKSPFDGLPHAGGGLSLRAVDLARVGYLVLRRGRWGTREIVPAAWIEESAKPVSSGPPLFFSGFGSAYGWFWWLFPAQRGEARLGVIAASGAGGQWLFVVPERDLVVVTIAANGAGLDLFYDLMAAVR